MENKVSISTLPYEFETLPFKFKILKENGVEFAHCDIMDGKFVENKTYTPNMLREIKKEMPLPLDVHLMVNNPLDYIEILKDVAYYYTIHCECFKTENELIEAVKIVKNNGFKAGIAVDLYTDENVILKVLEEVDLVLIMTVKAGAGGQKFNETALKKVEHLNLIRAKNKLNFQIEVDGGINDTNVSECVKAGANIVVSGSFVAKSNDLNKTIKSLKVSK